jgi:acetoin utilization deacetylase AcuC-like enzyme
VSGEPLVAPSDMLGWRNGEWVVRALLVSGRVAAVEGKVSAHGCCALEQPRHHAEVLDLDADNPSGFCSFSFRRGAEPYNRLVHK